MIRTLLAPAIAITLCALIGPAAALHSRFGIVPATRAATARQTAPVIGTARCGWPTEIMRMLMSIASAESGQPERVGAAAGAQTIATLGMLGIR